MDQLARWGLRWARDQLSDVDIDTGSFMWDFHRTLNTEQLPEGEHVFCVLLIDQTEATKWWLIVSNSSVDLCNEDPGYDVTLYITSTLTDLAKVWMGEEKLSKQIHNGHIKLTGNRHLQKHPEHWFPFSRYVDVQAANT